MSTIILGYRNFIFRIAKNLDKDIKEIEEYLGNGNELNRQGLDPFKQWN